jgi:hypothetical protein
MPFTMSLTKDGRCLFCVGSGLLKGQEIIDAKGELLATEDRIRGIAFGHIDLTDVTSVDISRDDIRRIADLDKRLALLAPRVVVAVIAPGAVVFGLSRMWETYANSTGWTIAVKCSKPEADAWVESRLAASCD